MCAIYCHQDVVKHYMQIGQKESSGCIDFLKECYQKLNKYCRMLI